MNPSFVALVLILGILLFAVITLFFYELTAIRTGSYPTISAYWTRFHRGRIVFLAVLGVVLTIVYVFLFGDLVLEWW